MAPEPAVSVIVCAYTDRRWTQIEQVLRGLAGQTRAPAEVLLVIDHNARLAGRARAAFPGVTVLDNGRRRGLSGARNTGIIAARGEVIAFIDDDATPHPDWLATLLAPYADPAVQAVGGSAVPVWPHGSRPSWLPSWPGRDETGRGELDWIVGCSYAGQPIHRAEVRNLMGCNMSFRRAVFTEFGGFAEDIGRIGAIPLGCEETELCIRLRQCRPEAQIVFEPAAMVDHHVEPGRIRPGYLRSRSWAEGVSKAAVARLVGSGDALATERTYLRRVLPAALFRQLASALRGRPGALTGAAAILLAVVMTALGYSRGLLGARRQAGPRAVAEGDPDAIYLTTHDARRGGIEVPVPEAESAGYRRAQVLLWDGRRTVDVVRVPVRDGRITLHGLAAAVAEPAAAPPPIPEPGHRPLVSVVVPTVDRPDALLRCVKSVLGSEYGHLEVIVVDNRPGRVAPRQWREFCTLDPRLRYVAETRRGVSHARNTGVAVAAGSYVAFVDDDIEVDRWWLTNLVAELADPVIDCATSLVLPARLDTPAQRAFEELKGFGQGLQRRVFGPELRATQPDYPFAPGQFGPGGCALWRRSTLLRLGGFDPLLGPGTHSQSGEDLHLFLRLASAGGRIVYTPHAVAFHEHATDWPELRARIRGYGTGLSAMLLLHLVRRPGDLPRLLRVLPAHAWRVVRGAPGPAPERRLGGDRTGAAGTTAASASGVSPSGPPPDSAGATDSAGALTDSVAATDSAGAAADFALARKLLPDQWLGLLAGPFALARSAARQRRIATGSIVHIGHRPAGTGAVGGAVGGRTGDPGAPTGGADR